MNKRLNYFKVHQYLIVVLVFISSCGLNSNSNLNKKTILSITVTGIDSVANLLILNDVYDTIHKSKIINNINNKVIIYENKMYSVGYPYIVRVYNDNKNYSHIIYIEKHKNNAVSFDLQKNDLLHKFKGEVVYTNGTVLQKEINNHFVEIANFQSKFLDEKKDKEEYDELMKEFMLDTSIPFIYKYPNNDYSKLILYIILNNGDKDLLDALKSFFLDTEHQKKYFFKKTDLYDLYISRNKLSNIKESVEKNDVGLKKVYIDAINQKRESFDLNNLKGKIIIIDIWATWCKPCLKVMPKYIELANKPNYKNKIELVFLSIDNQFEVWDKYVDKNLDKNFIHLIDLIGNTKKFYNINQIPANLIINKEGYLIGQNILQINSLKSVIDSWSKQSNSPP